MSYQCRICLEEDNKQNLVAPCVCNGTSKYIHPRCLTSWREQNINTPYFNTCIDCRQEYVYEISQKEYIFISSQIMKYIYLFLLGCFTIFLPYFENNYSIKLLEHIKEKNITQILDSSTYYYIFYYIIISNYIINCILFVISWCVFIFVVNKSKYLSKIYNYKLLLFFNICYIYVFYILFNFNIFLFLSLLFVFISLCYDYSFILNHNRILFFLNNDNIKYRGDYDNNYEDSNEQILVINNNILIETIEEDIERNAQYENEELRAELL